MQFYENICGIIVVLFILVFCIGMSNGKIKSKKFLSVFIGVIVVMVVLPYMLVFKTAEAAVWVTNFRNCDIAVAEGEESAFAVSKAGDNSIQVSTMYKTENGWQWRPSRMQEILLSGLGNQNNITTIQLYRCKNTDDYYVSGLTYSDDLTDSADSMFHFIEYERVHDMKMPMYYIAFIPGFDENYEIYDAGETLCLGQAFFTEKGEMFFDLEKLKLVSMTSYICLAIFVVIMWLIKHVKVKRRNVRYDNVEVKK